MYELFQWTKKHFTVTRKSGMRHVEYACFIMITTGKGMKMELKQ